ncbi:DEAD/DEAH box helicase [Carboxylicivirga mesophila]|uniref:DEAD/DEAH box helicase n=1 Tax=Carboxylicivirga mesophila TaxID=1166478 RepID=A0ABS5KBU8_9BACT|nr:DEAD/DEAH box helicase [Carboxylicivirga mesophila]MBS2212011.1 DEAD/DEAH box helicase [Carboxylicivirga mesophila]
MQHLSKASKAALHRLNIQALNPMQEAAMEAIGQRQDTILLSPTGSGKTLAFLLPLLEQLDRNIKNVQVLILTPARELALQIESVFKQMQSGFKVNCCYGGHAIRTEINNLKHPPAVLIGTPGRIADHLRRGSFKPSETRFLVLDEFDKALELGFQKEMKEIAAQLRGVKQRVLTSATPMEEIPPFTQLREPVELNYIDEQKQPDGLQLKAARANEKDKLALFVRLIGQLGNAPMLAFVNHRDAADRISNHLNDQSVAHDVFHGGMKQEDRERALIKFRNGSHHLLITTDLASRGLDIPEIEYVIHYHLPSKEDAFIHRNGRTARMHADGTAYVLLSEGEELPSFIPDTIYFEEVLAEAILPEPPEWQTIYIGSGKKDKINKVDIVGLFLKKGKLQKDELGLIDVLDHSAFVAIRRNKVKKVLQLLKHEKIKGKKLKMAVSK